MESEIYYINMDGNIYFKVEDGVVCSQGKQTSVSARQALRLPCNSEGAWIYNW